MICEKSKTSRAIFVISAMQDCMEMHRLRMQMQGDFARNLKTDAGTYIARNPMQGILMHSEKNQGTAFQMQEKLMHGFLLHESIMHEKNIAGAHKSANPSAKPHKTAFLHQNQTKNAKCIKVMSI